jgi:hypothetical protein
MAISAYERAHYLVTRGYYPADTDINQLASEIEASLLRIKREKREMTQIVNDINTVYIDKTKPTEDA